MNLFSRKLEQQVPDPEAIRKQKIKNIKKRMYNKRRMERKIQMIQNNSINPNFPDPSGPIPL